MEADLVIAWDTKAVSPEDYAELVVAIGDLVRARGGAGIARILPPHDERMKCAQIAAKECSCGEPFERCHVAQEILIAREEQEAKGQ